MLLAMVVLASSAMATNEKTVYAGSDYDYVLTGVYSANAATASVAYSTPAQVTITQSGTSYTVPAATSHNVGFNVDYGSSAASGVITVTVTDGTSGCSNTIQLHITVMPPPVYTLTISVDQATTCQARTGAADELADAMGGETNTLTYTITPVVENVVTGITYEHTFDFQLPATTALITDVTSTNANVTTYPDGTVTVSGTGTGSGDQGASAVTIEVTFGTVVGEATQTLTASLPDVTDTANASLTINDGSNAGVGTVIAAEIASGGSASASTSVLAVPSMGAF